jgi:two-component system alkaline phosphatase synthesis response regulator PhoP
MDENKPNPSNKKILMIDDDLALLELFTTVFNSAGFNLSVAKNGTEALEKAKIEKPDLILLDIMLPDINGLEVLKRLKRDPETSHVPIWMITNLAEQISRETASSLGASDYLVKASLTPKQICDKVNAFFNGTPST